MKTFELVRRGGAVMLRRSGPCGRGAVVSSTSIAAIAGLNDSSLRDTPCRDLRSGSSDGKSLPHSSSANPVPDRQRAT